MTTTISEVKSDLRYRRISVDPDMAMAILTSNTDNRPVDQTRINKYAKHMAHGLWKQTSAEVIQIATDGRLIDGQHRLKAIIQSGVTVTLTIVDGCDADTFDVIDTGKTRTHNDVFSIAQMGQGTAALARIVYLYEKMMDKDWRQAKVGNVSTVELLSWAKDKQEILETAARLGRKVNKPVRPLGRTAGAVMAILDLFGGVSCESTFELFYRPMIDLVGYDPSSPPLLFYYFIRQSQDSRAEAGGPFAVNAGSSTETNRRKIILQLMAARDTIQNLPRKTYRWRDDFQMPDVRKMKKAANANSAWVRQRMEEGATQQQLADELGITREQFDEHSSHASN